MNDVCCVVMVQIYLMMLIKRKRFKYSKTNFNIKSGSNEKIKIYIFNDYEFYDYNSHIHMIYCQNAEYLFDYGVWTSSGKFKIFNDKKNIKILIKFTGYIDLIF